MTDVRVFTEPLGGSPLSRQIQQGTAPSHWGPARPETVDEWLAHARRRLQERDWSRAWDAISPALSASGAAAQRLDRVRREGGIVVTTGQQPGLFGGPVYTWSKALGALAFSDALERDIGIPTAPVFWAATDDADFAEASYTVLARTGGVETLRSPYEPPAGTPMSLAPLGDMSTLLQRLRHAASSAADPRPLEAAEQAYGTPGATVGSAYVSLLRALLEPLGIPVLDAGHPAVVSAGRPTMQLALQRGTAVESALRARSGELRGAGFDAQVEDVPGLSLVFVREAGIKRRLAIAEANGSKLSAAPLTPNVLLRPILEQAILPTVAYLGGPGELAYFAQTSAVADALGVSRPLALPRWSCTLIEPHVQRLLDRVGVTREALEQPEVLEGRVARSAMSVQSSDALGRLRALVEALPQQLAPEAAPLGLDAAMHGAVQSLLHRVDRLERRLVAGIKRREVDKLRDVATLRAALYPKGVRQERALNLLPMLGRHGLALLEQMRDEAGTHARRLVHPTRAASGE